MEAIVRRNKIRKLPSDKPASIHVGISFLLLNSTLYVNKEKNRKELIVESNLLEKETRLFEEARPDIVHNTLLMLLDSPLCKAGYLSEIIVLNSDRKLLRIDPKFRVPRSFKIFSKVFSEFLSSPNGELKLPDGSAVLGIRSDSVDEYLSSSDIVIGFSKAAKKENLQKFMKENIKEKVSGESLNKLVFVVGATSKGSTCDFYSSLYSHYISICDISMPTYICCSKICSEMEEILGIL